MHEMWERKSKKYKRAGLLFILERILFNFYPQIFFACFSAISSSFGFFATVILRLPIFSSFVLSLFSTKFNSHLHKSYNK